MTCSTCIHWKALEKLLCGCVDDDDQPMFGKCRRVPPIIVESLIAGRILPSSPDHDLAPTSDIYRVIEEATAFPITDRNSACGELESEMPL